VYVCVFTFWFFAFSLFCHFLGFAVCRIKNITGYFVVEAKTYASSKSNEINHG